jgi:hypothetical protein
MYAVSENSLQLQEKADAVKLSQLLLGRANLRKKFAVSA